MNSIILEGCYPDTVNSIASAISKRTGMEVVEYHDLFGDSANLEIGTVYDLEEEDVSDLYYDYPGKYRLRQLETLQYNLNALVKVSKTQDLIFKGFISKLLWELKGRKIGPRFAYNEDYLKALSAVTQNTYSLALIESDSFLLSKNLEVRTEQLRYRIAFNSYLENLSKSIKGKGTPREFNVFDKVINLSDYSGPESSWQERQSFIEETGITIGDIYGRGKPLPNGGTRRRYEL